MEVGGWRLGAGSELKDDTKVCREDGIDIPMYHADSPGTLRVAIMGSIALIVDSDRQSSYIVSLE